MTILQCVNNLDIGGAERLVLSLSRELVAKGYPTIICCIEDRGALADQAEAAGISVHALHLARVGKLAAFRNFCAFLRRCRQQSPPSSITSPLPLSSCPITLSPQPSALSPQPSGLRSQAESDETPLPSAAISRLPVVIHSHNYKPCLYSSLARLTGVVGGHVQTRHGVFTSAAGSHRRYRLLRPGVDRFVAVSTESQQMLAQITGLNPDRVPVILNGVDTDQFIPVPNRSALRGALGLPSEMLAIVSVARLSPEKDFGTMLQAFSLVRQQRQDVELWIVGDGPQRTALEQQARSCGLASAIRFLGARSDVERVLAAGDIFSLASISEGLPMAVLEAGAAGLPIVATAVGEIPQVVHPPECGLLVTPGNADELAQAYLELLRSPSLREAMGSASRKRMVEHFSLQAMVRHYIEVYEEIFQ